MRKITKSGELKVLSNWKRDNPDKTYNDLPEDGELRRSIRMFCTQEQYYLCAYCCKEISGNRDDTVNEHIIPRDIKSNKSLDIDNIVASCNTKNQCDSAHKNEILPLTPLMSECENEFRFLLNGKVEGLTDRAKAVIKILNLGDLEKNNRSLIQQRKQMIDAVLFSELNTNNPYIEDDSLLELLIEDLNIPDNGKLKAFSPVIINILKQWISGRLT